MNQYIYDKLAKSAVNKSQIPTWQSLVEYLYNDPSRHYHNLGHIEDCLRLADSYPGKVDSATSDDIDTALIFHDLIYDTKRKDNEDLSSVLCFLYSESYYASFLILGTKKHELMPGCDIADKIVVDCDLASLGYDYETFSKNTGKIRQEYSQYVYKDFLAGRIAFLKSMLDRKRIYYTDFFYDKFEKQARENMERSLEEMTSVKQCWND